MKALKQLWDKVREKLLSREIISYLIFGVATTAVGFLSYALFLRLGFGVALANTFSHFLAILFAYVTNKIWVFRALNFSAGTIVKEFFKFLSGRLAAYVIETLLLVLLVDLLGYHALLSKAFTSVIVIILNYLVSKKIVFKSGT